MSKIEIEKRYLVQDLDLIRELLVKLGAALVSEKRLVDHWFVPTFLKSRAEHDQWYDHDRGCGVRIRENHNQVQEIKITLDGKRLTEALNHNTIQEASVVINAYLPAKELLEMMGLREFLTIDKTRTTYELDGIEIMLDTIAGFGSGIEIELSGEDRQKTLQKIENIATKLGLSDLDCLEKSMTVLAMEKLAIF